jgi:DNA polymerase-3 subunit epsilon
MRRISTQYIALDVETTGLFVEKGHRVIEIGAVRMDGDVMGEEFQSLINTDKPITKEAWKVHGITAEMLAGQPGAKDVLPAFRDFTGTCTLVAHNAAFDVGFLQREFMRAGLVFNGSHKCTLKMSRKLFPGLGNYKLETIARHLGIPVDKTRRHRALDDARLTAQVWIEVRKE